MRKAKAWNHTLAGVRSQESRDSSLTNSRNRIAAALEQTRLRASFAGRVFFSASSSAQKKVRDLQERYKTKQTELNYLKIVRPVRVAYLGTALVYPGVAVVNDCAQMRNDPEVEAIAMQFVMNYERDRGWQPQDISKDGDGSGFDIRSVGAADPETGKSPVRRIEVKGRAQFNQPVSLTVNEWRKAQQLEDSYWLYVVWGYNTPNPQLLTIQNPARVLAGEAKEIKQVTRYLVRAEALKLFVVNS